MGDTLAREAQPGTVVTGMQPQPDAPNPTFPIFPNPQPAMPISRPTFMSAFLQNLGPALAGGAGATTLGGGLGGALQGIEEQKRYGQSQDLQQQQLQRQANQDYLASQNTQSEMHRRDVQNQVDLNPPQKPETTLNELERYLMENPGKNTVDYMKLKASLSGSIPATPHNTVTTDKGIFQYNPKTNAYDIKVGNPPVPKAPVEKTPAQDAFERKVGENAATAIQTAQGADFRLNSMNASYPSALKGDQQAMLNLLTNHLGMTMGMQKGARITKDILREAQDSAPWLSTIKAKFDGRGYLSGAVLTPDQMRQMMDLAVESQKNAWQSVDQAAAQAGVTDRVKRTNTATPSSGIKIIRDASGRISGIE